MYYKILIVYLSRKRIFMIKENSNTKHQDIFNTGKKLFWKYGIKRITVEEICKEAGVSKMTYYKFFQNKIELAQAILSETLEQSMKKFDEIIGSNLPFSEIIESIFLMKMEAIDNFSHEFIHDVYNNPKFGLLDYLNEQVEKLQDRIKNFYKDAQLKGHIRKNVNVDFVMSFSMSIQNYMQNERLMAQYASPKDFILEVMNMMFYGIVSRDE